jgi:uncharacterized protein (DUF1501 family)
MPEEHPSPTRRSLLQWSWRALASAGVAGRLRLQAANRGPNRTLVCIYLFGGNDSNNLIVPLGAAQYDAYALSRGKLALSSETLLPVKALTSQAAYGFHPALEELRDIYESQALAVVANVGRTNVARQQISHMDDSLSYLPNGFVTPHWSASLTGWKGTGPIHNAFTGFPGLDSERTETGMSLIAPDAASAGDRLRDALHQRATAGIPGLRITFPSTGIGQQLQEVASLIYAGATLGLGRQVFVCPLSGFDTHRDQLPRQAALFRQLSEAMSAFHTATVAMGVAHQVTTFTDSEFSRTLRPNALDGTEHAWGGHHLVMGGSVLGGDVYGEFPELMPGGPDDAESSGVWIPKISKDQYAATLARWFGVPSSGLPDLFPRLSGEAAPLGFLA